MPFIGIPFFMFRRLEQTDVVAPAKRESYNRILPDSKHGAVARLPTFGSFSVPPRCGFPTLGKFGCAGIVVFQWLEEKVPDLGKNCL